MKPDWIEGYYDSVSYQISIWYILYTLHSLLCKTLLCSETGRVGKITIYHIYFHNCCWIYIHIYVYVYVYIHDMGINICAYSSDHGVSWDRKRHHTIYFPTEPGPDGIDNQILGIIFLRYCNRSQKYLCIWGHCFKTRQYCYKRRQISLLFPCPNFQTGNVTIRMSNDITQRHVTT